MGILKQDKKKKNCETIVNPIMSKLYQQGNDEQNSTETPQGMPSGMPDMSNMNMEDMMKQMGGKEGMEDMMKKMGGKEGLEKMMKNMGGQQQTNDEPSIDEVD